MQPLNKGNNIVANNDQLELPSHGLEINRHKSSAAGLLEDKNKLDVNYQVVKGAKAVGDALNIYGFTDLSTPYAKKNNDSDSDDSN